MRVRRILPILQLAAAALLAQDRAKVVNAGKGWRYQGKLAYRGLSLPAVDPQKNEASPPSEKLLAAGKDAGELLLDCPRGLVKYVCKPDTSCTVPACIDQAGAKAQTAWASAVVSELPAAVRNAITEAMWRSFLTREPREVATLGVRGGGNPVDALLLIDAKGVHWGPALARVLEGRYCLRLTPLPSGAARAVTMDWDRATDAEGIAPASGIVAGIYSLDKGMPGAAGACSMESDARAAWVVIAPEAQFNRMSPGWKQQSAEITQLERSDAGPDVAATLRHAVLASLADSVASK